MYTRLQDVKKLPALSFVALVQCPDFLLPPEDGHLLVCKRRKIESIILLLAPVVQRVESITHWIS